MRSDKSPAAIPARRRSGRRSLVAPVLAVLLGASLRPATAAVPPDIVILCEPTLRPVLQQVARQWRQQSGGRMRLFSTSTAAALREAGYGARADVVFGAGAELAIAARAQGVLRSDDLIGLWQDSLVLATRTMPATTDAVLPLDRLLGIIGNSRVATIDGSLPPDTLTALELAGAPLARHVDAASSEDAVQMLDSGDVAFALLYATDLAAHRQFRQGATFAPETVAPALVWAGQSSQSRSPEMAHFAEFLKQPEVGRLLEAGGLRRMAP